MGPRQANLPTRIVLLLASVAMLAGQGWLHAQQSMRDGEEDVATAPVEIDGEVLFRLRGISSFPAQMRAERVKERIVEAARDPAVTIDSIRIVDVDGVPGIVAGDRAIMAVADADAALEQADVRHRVQATASELSMHATLHFSGLCSHRWWL